MSNPPGRWWMPKGWGSCASMALLVATYIASFFFFFFYWRSNLGPCIHQEGTYTPELNPGWPLSSADFAHYFVCLSTLCTFLASPSRRVSTAPSAKALTTSSTASLSWAYSLASQTLWILDEAPLTPKSCILYASKIRAIGWHQGELQFVQQPRPLGLCLPWPLSAWVTEQGEMNPGETVP